jgi:hypothetical protein
LCIAQSPDTPVVKQIKKRKSRTSRTGVTTMKGTAVDPLGRSPRSKKKRGDRFPSGPPRVGCWNRSPARDNLRNKNRRKFLCQWDIVVDANGSRPVRVPYPEPHLLPSCEHPEGPVHRVVTHVRPTGLLVEGGCARQGPDFEHAGWQEAKMVHRDHAGLPKSLKASETRTVCRQLAPH